MRRARGVVVGLWVWAVASVMAVAGTPSAVQITADWKTPGRTIPSDFSGLSFETRRVLPDAQGKYYFTPENKALIATFKMLGVKSLRIGGNTSDQPEVKVPARQDVDHLFRFAQAAEAPVMYTLRLRGLTDPQDDVKIAGYIWKHYKSQVTCFAVGNEPNVYDKEYGVYREAISKFYAAILKAAPGAKFCGPGTTPGKAAWAHDFTVDMARSGWIRYITQHSYPGGSARKVKDPESGRDQMLSPEFVQSYLKFYNAFGPVVEANHLTYRLEETNNFFNGGAKDVSDTMASALWGLDYMYWWAWRGAQGLNFHTGDEVAAGEAAVPCRYAVYWTSAQGNNVHPLGYALKAFEVADPGELVALNVEYKDAESKNPESKDAEKQSTENQSPEKPAALNLTAYGVRAPDQTFFVTVINKEHGDSGRDAAVTIVPGAAYTRASVMFMTSPNHDAAATAGITLGDAQINDDASWSGKWAELSSASASAPSSSADHSSAGHGTWTWTLTVPQATAAVVKFSTK